MRRYLGLAISAGLLLAASPAVAAFCPCYTPSSSSDVGCAIEAVPGTNPSVAAWNDIFQDVAQGPVRWLTAGPSIQTMTAGCNRPQPLLQLKPVFPCELLRAMAMVEGAGHAWVQFCAPDRPADQVGLSPRTAIADDCGYGAFQITDGMSNGSDPVSWNRSRVAAEPFYNVATGALKLREKWEAAACVGDNQPQTIEHWYNATWAYNGRVYKNNPNYPEYSTLRGVFDPKVGSDSSHTYQEKVWGWMEHPPSPAHWTALFPAYPYRGEITDGTGVPSRLSEPHCASPTNCAQSRKTNDSACIGKIQIKATLDGASWPTSGLGSVTYLLAGPGELKGTQVPLTLGEAEGIYQLVHTGGGPAGATLSSISPVPAQYHFAGGTTTFTLNFASGACQAGGLRGMSCTPPPTVTFTANPTSVTAGNSSTLTWSSSNATSCIASGGWSGSQSTSGSKNVTPGGTTTYTLTCSGAGGSTSKSATVTVNGSGSSPAVYLAAFPQTVTAGTAVGLGWATSNAASCTASGGWSGAQPLSGGATVFPSTTTVYTLTCTGTGGGSANASVTVMVTASPSVSLAVSPPAIDPGGTATLQWTTTGMTSCSGSGGWSGSKAVNGSQQVSPASTTTYFLNCNGSAPAPQELVRNGGFSGVVNEWVLSTNFYAGSSFGTCNLTCPGYAYVSEPNGNLSLSNNLFGTMRQDISLPSTASSITLTFWVSISTLETSSTQFDVLSVSLLNTQGSPLQLIQTFSNVNAGGYRKTTFDLTPYKGQTVRLNFVGTTNSTNGTVFRVDDVSVLATLPAQQYSTNATLTVRTPSPPGLSFTATPDVVAPGGASTLAWTSAGTTGCTASNGWSGTRPTSGNQVVNPSVTTTYALSCSGPGGTVTGSATVVVQSPPPSVAPKVLLFASRQACAGAQPAVLLGWTMPQGADPLVTLRRSDGKYVATVNTAVKGPVHEVDSGLFFGNVYHFRAEANLDGLTIVSNDVTVPVSSDECRLPVLTNDLPHRPVLWAEPPYCDNGVAKVRLNWTEGLGAEWYSLDRTAIYMDSASYDNISGQSRTWVDSSLTPGAGASYELTAHNGAGSMSSWRVGIVVPGTVCDTAGAPGSFAAQAEDAVCSEAKGAVTVRWDQSAGAASEYRIFELDGHQLYRVYENKKTFAEQLTSLQPDTVSRAVVQARSATTASEFREAYPVAQLTPVDICGAGTLSPSIGGASASYIRADQALLRVSITANGSDTGAYFEWGTSPAYGLQTSSRIVGNKYSFVTLGEVLGGLSCGTTYHFRAVAVNNHGRTDGTDQVFATPPCEEVPVVSCGRLLVQQPRSEVGGCDASDTGIQWRMAENFRLTDRRAVSCLEVLGYYWPDNDPPPTSVLDVVFHEVAANGTPGAVVHEDRGAHVLRQKTGNVLAGMEEWRFSVELATPVELDAGSYFVEVAGAAGVGGSFCWSDGQKDPVAGLDGLAYSGNGQWSPGSWNLALKVFEQSTTEASDFYTVTPCRVVDTRNPTGSFGGPALSSGSSRVFTLAGHCGIPVGAVAVAMNVTAVNAGGGGYVTLFPGDQAVPGTSSINFIAGQNRANNAVIKLSNSGTLGVWSVVGGTGQVDFIIDVVGYFIP